MSENLKKNVRSNEEVSNNKFNITFDPNKHKTFNISAVWEPDTKEPFLSTYKKGQLKI